LTLEIFVGSSRQFEEEVLTKKYRLELTEEQAVLVKKALDFYSRIHIGQFGEILNLFRFKDRESERLLYPKAKETVDYLKHLLTGLDSSASYGVFSLEAHEDCRRAFDIVQVIRNKIAFEKNPEGGCQVDFDTPEQLSDWPLPGVEVLEEDKAPTVEIKHPQPFHDNENE